MMVEPYKPLYTVKEVSKVLGVNLNYVYDLIKKGKLPYLQLGVKKIRGSDLEKFIERYPTEVEAKESDPSASVHIDN